VERRAAGRQSRWHSEGIIDTNHLYITRGRL